MVDIKTLEQMGIKPETVRALSDIFGVTSVGERYGASTAFGRIPDWWSPERDKALRVYARSVDHISSAIHSLQVRMAAIPLRVQVVNDYITAHRRLAKEYEYRINNYSGAGNGWGHEFSNFLYDYYTQDNGAFLLVLAEGRKDQPVDKKTVYGVQHLDSSRCIRTSDKEFPVVYMSPDGKKYKIHYSRIIDMVSNPMPISTMNGVGFCAVSRCIQTILHLQDINIYRAEKLGSVPLRAIFFVNNVSAEQWEDALRHHSELMDMQGLSRYSRILTVVNEEAETKAELIPLTSVPDGFNEYTSITQSMYLIAMAFGVDARELWPTSDFGATIGEATLSHYKALSKEPAYFVNQLTIKLTDRLLPNTLRLELDHRDDAQEKARSEIRTAFALTRKRESEIGLPTELLLHDMLTSGHITQESYEISMLARYKTVDGDKIEILFASNDPFYRKYLNIWKNRDDILRYEEEYKAYALEQIHNNRLELYRLRNDTNNPLIISKIRHALKALEYAEFRFKGQIGTFVIGETLIGNPDSDQEIELLDTSLNPDALSPEVTRRYEEQQRPPIVEKSLRSSRKNGDEDEVADWFLLLFLNFQYNNITSEQFEEEFETILNRLKERAFERIRSLTGQELTKEDLNRLERFLDDLRSYKRTLQEKLLYNDYSSVQLQNMARLWANQYLSLIDEVLQGMDAQQEQRYIWVMNPEKEHCADCLALSGTVLTMEKWKQYGVLPRSSYLTCSKEVPACGCQLLPTDLPETTQVPAILSERK